MRSWTGVHTRVLFIVRFVCNHFIVPVPVQNNKARLFFQIRYKQVHDSSTHSTYTLHTRAQKYTREMIQPTPFDVCLYNNLYDGVLREIFFRFLDPDWWRKGAGRKEDSEMFRELTFRLGFLMQVTIAAAVPEFL